MVIFRCRVPNTPIFKRENVSLCFDFIITFGLRSCTIKDVFYFSLNQNILCDPYFTYRSTKAFKVFVLFCANNNVVFFSFSRRAFPDILTRRARAFFPTECGRTAPDPVHRILFLFHQTPALISTGTYIIWLLCQQVLVAVWFMSTSSFILWLLCQQEDLFLALTSKCSYTLWLLYQQGWCIFLALISKYSYTLWLSRQQKGILYSLVYVNMYW